MNSSVAAKLVVAVLLAVATSPITALAQTVPVQIPSSDLVGVTWMWLRSEYSDDSTTVAVDPSRYTLEFHSDGTIGIAADCNRVIGTYSQQSSQLTIRLGPATLAACPADSQANTFLADVGRVASYVMDGGNLVLNMKLDSGNVVMQPQSSAALLNVGWQLQSLNNGQAVTNPLAGTQVTARFGGDGNVAGSAGCNTYSGTFTATGNALSFGLLAITEKACAAPIMDQETAFLRALQATTTFSLANGQLTLFDANGAIQANFTSTPSAARPLPTGVPWRIQSYNNGRDAVVDVSPTSPGDEPAATFGDDGSVTGSTGCNTFRATFTSSGSSVAFGPLATTRRECVSDSASAQEQAIIAAFGATVSFELLGDRMTLRSADGATQMILLRRLNGVIPG